MTSVKQMSRCVVVVLLLAVEGEDLVTPGHVLQGGKQVELETRHVLGLQGR